MTTAAGNAWISGWSADDPLYIGYTSAPHDSGTWEQAPHPAVQFRNLGLDAVSGGKMGAQHIRIKGSELPPTDWHCHDVDFQFMYVLSGSATYEDQHGEKHKLAVGDTAYFPGLYWYRTSDASDDFELLEIKGPAAGAMIYGRDSALPERAASLDAGRRGIYTFDSPEAYTKGAGPRKFFLYRDLGTSGPTEGRVHIHVVRATQPEAGTGWHYHTMSQWFWILGGSSVIRVEDGPQIDLRVGDSMCLGAGPEMRHNVAPLTGDYAVLEMCVPQNYETIAVDPPVSAAPPPAGARE
jgi:quercetin dioxygenase-like cupin family protein